MIKTPETLFGRRRFSLHFWAAGLLRGAAIGSVLLMQPGAAAAATGSFRVTASVPVLCMAHPDSAITLTNGALSSGKVTEACNKSGGYTVVANYRPLDHDEHATLVYNGVEIKLPASGSVVLHVSRLATIVSVAYSVSDVQVNSPIDLELDARPA
jgi:hypothetical protein